MFHQNEESHVKTCSMLLIGSYLKISMETQEPGFAARNRVSGNIRKMKEVDRAATLRSKNSTSLRSRRSSCHLWKSPLINSTHKHTFFCARHSNRYTAFGNTRVLLRTLESENAS